MSRVEFDYEVLAAKAILRDKAADAVKLRKHTGRPGDGWHLDEIGRPQYFGRQGRAWIHSTDDGKAFEVILFSHAGDEIGRQQWKGLDSAFRNGQKMANES